MASIRIIHVVIILSMVLSAYGHTNDEIAAHSGESHDRETPETYPTTYFTLETHQLAMQAHICLMILSWIIILPIATMLSLARSRHTHFVRLGFTATNTIGLLFAVSYKNKTSDLYPGSAHSAVGWIATGIVAVQVSHLLVGPMTKLFSRLARPNEIESGTYTLSPMRESFHSLRDHDGRSGLSRQGSIDVEATHVLVEDRDTSSNLRLYQEDPPHESGFASEDDTCFGESDSIRVLHHHPSPAFLKILSTPFLSRTRRLILLMYDVMDSTILIVAFVAFCTGIVTFWGLFKGHAIFNGIAHWIKGGVFFWLGIFNLGRWCGCFAEKGWAWNIRPGTSEAQFWLSAEFVESSLIFFYGSTNIFLEHLAGWGKAWTARDLQHVAITVLFIGGGLCGMLVEYIRVRGLGEQKIRQLMHNVPGWSNGITDENTQHKSNGISINPLPALVIFLMGGSMASHEQASMVSTMVHKQWGNLLGAASVARLLTYLIMYLKPPISMSPSRPPSELLSSFCLISGGILFMASSSDTIDGMIHNDIDPMALYTVTMGFTGILMAWIIGLLVLKDWASR
ncbi:hypothetical protein BJX63DRAFT_435707 [Aspergillus granulosus]|uniref:Integral membrane protein n=1 Tax=Aspergillus granulosus TaxID=176169 RepID=A0ABR4H276_9EURO